jgi:hypothetical protein
MVAGPEQGLDVGAQDGVAGADLVQERGPSSRVVYIESRQNDLLFAHWIPDPPTRSRSHRGALTRSRQRAARLGS